MRHVLIRKLESLHSLSDEDRTLIDKFVAGERTINARTDIVGEGDTQGDVNLIVDGLACRYKLLANGNRQIVAYLLPGDFCNLHAYMLRAMDHSIATIIPTKVVDIDRADIFRLLERPSISAALLMTTLVDEGTLREWVVNLGQRPAEQRIAHLFCELYARMDAIGLAENGEVDIPLTQIELGDTVGLSTVHVNRCLQGLRSEGLIVFKSGRLSILDMARLRQLSGFRPNYLHLNGAAAFAQQ